MSRFQVMHDIELERLHVSPFRPRAWPLPWPTPGELARARETGLLEPATVRPLSAGPAGDYEILAGLKHWLLAQRLGVPAMPVAVRDVGDGTARRWVEAEAEASASARDPIAVARAIGRRVREGASVAAAGREFGLTRTDASHRLRLLRLVPDVREQVARGELAPGTARALVGLEPAFQRDLAARIRRERLTSREAEALAQTAKGGAGPPAPPAGRRAAEDVSKDPDLCRLEAALSDLVGSPVELRYAGGDGELAIRFERLDVLEGILARLGYSADER